MLIEHNREKLIEVVRYFALSVKKLGKTKLFKLIYFLDFEHYRETGRSVTGLEYFAWKMGPVPVALYEEIESPEPDWAEKVTFKPISIRGGQEMLSVQPHGEFDAKYFSKREMRMMNALADQYKNSDSEEMVEATHLENLPWNRIYNIEGKRQEIIPFQLALRAQERDLMVRLVSERNDLVQVLRS